MTGIHHSLTARLLAKEESTLSPFACASHKSQGRLRPEPNCPVRLAFQIDRDRIVLSKTFRRLTHKTQVFLAPIGDHYRNRLTHALEVAQIARTIAVALGLNEALTEAIALGHDLGHTPFGHAGETTLNELIPGGFRHYEQSLRVVDFLEDKGKGLNLTHEVRDGILKHSKGRDAILPDDLSHLPRTLEGQVVRLSDIIAYVNHDLDDALRAQVLTEEQIPRAIRDRLGHRHPERLGVMIRDLIANTLATGGERLAMSREMLDTIDALRSFLFANVYEISQVHGDFIKAMKILRELYTYFTENAVPLGDPTRGQDWASEIAYGPEVSRATMVGDFIAGMTDRYALDLYMNIFFPKPWSGN